MEESTLGSRLKAARKALNKTQEEFCEGLKGLKRQNLAAIESGRSSNPGELLILEICNYHNIGYDYLTTGNGPMFPERTESDQIIDFANDLIGPNADPFMRRLVLALIKLDPSERAALRHLSDEIHAQDQGK